MRISDIFIGQRAFKNEPLEFFWAYGNTVSSAVVGVGRKIQFGCFNTTNPADQQYYGGGTHGTYVNDGDIYVNKSGMFDIELGFDLYINNGQAIEEPIYIQSNGDVDRFYDSIHMFQGDNGPDGGSTTDSHRTLTISTTTPHIKKGQMFSFSMSFVDNVSRSVEIRNARLEIREVARLRNRG